MVGLQSRALNLNGRVALPISACWGLGVVLIVKLVQPLVHHWAAATIAASGDLVAVLLLAATTFDLGFTLANMLAFGAATQRIGEEIEARKKKNCRPKSMPTWRGWTATAPPTPSCHPSITSSGAC
nr:hypothetical protein [Lacticaseibacillus nasuensis]